MSGEAVDIKGTRNGLVIVFNPESDPEDIKSNLRLKMEKANGFFKGAKFSFSNTRGDRSLHFISELEGICRQYGLIPSGEESFSPPARIVGPPAGKKRPSQVIPIRQLQSGEEQAVLVTRTIRSGQKVCSDKTLIILGDVNPGAEVVSENSIYIMGGCKGNIHAGSGGNIHAEVFAFKLHPSAIRIGTISADTTGPPEPWPRVARVSRGKIVFTRYANNILPDY